ncbi:MAG: hypothetical protein LH472_15700 [Pyrinomonadaceae bacterium]|nr:hypothetical protein [Pyrinomonadaceae bacterium]
MSKETITKKFAFVIFLFIAAGLFSACSAVLSSQTANDNSAKKKTARWGNPEIVGTIKTDEITESSGLVVSKCQPNVFWTHNDSGDGAFIFALNEKGEKLGTFKVEDAKNRDWEDIGTFKTANGECFLYLGDIGNNVRVRDESIIYRVKEPTVTEADKSSNNKNPSKTEDAQKIRFEYPDIRHDAETLFVHPNTGDIYILTKRLSGASGVYKLSKNYDVRKTNPLEKIADFTVPAIPNGFLTGGDISSDGKRVVVCDYFNAYEIILPETAKNFDEIWKQKPSIIQLGKREQGEAVAYSIDGETIYATSESRNSPFIKVEKLKLKEP